MRRLEGRAAVDGEEVRLERLGHRGELVGAEVVVEVLVPGQQAERHAVVREALALPAEVIPQALITLGYGALEPPVRERRPLEELVLLDI